MNSFYHTNTTLQNTKAIEDSILKLVIFKINFPEAFVIEDWMFVVYTKRNRLFKRNLLRKSLVKTTIMKLLLSTIFILSNLLVFAQKPKDILSSKYSSEELKQIILPPEKWYKEPIYPSKFYRSKYTSKQFNDLLKKGENYLNYQWPAITASSYLAFDAIGSRDTMEKTYFERTAVLDCLVEAELAEGKGRFLNKIIDGVWTECEESFWGVSAHVHLQKRPGSLPDISEPIIDLFASERALKLSHIYYLFRSSFDRVNPLISERIHTEIYRRVLEPYYQRDDFSWLGFNNQFVNNWTPWINANILTAVLLMEENPEKRAKAAYKAMRSIDKYINFVKPDGWCDEGPSYWGVAGAKVFTALDMLYECTRGKVNVFDQPIIKNLGTYVYYAYIGKGYYVNFGDASVKNSYNIEQIFKWGQYISDSKMMGFASFLAQKANYIANPSIINYNPWEPLSKSFWFPDNQVGGGHASEETRDGFYFVAKGGVNQKGGHSHNDVGTCIVHFDDQPILIDAGKLFYTKESFGEKRYTFWPTRSDYHNVPTINGVNQSAGEEFKAKNVQFKSDDNHLLFSLDISQAYPQSANVDYWKRTYKLQRPNLLTISDDYQLKEFKGISYLNFLTCCKVIEIKPGLLSLKSGNTIVQLSFDSKLLEPIIEEFDVNDKTVESSWGKRLTHLRLKILSTAPRNTIEISLSKS